MTTEQNATTPGAFESAASARSKALNEIASSVHERNAEDLQSFDEGTGQLTGKAAEPAKEAPSPEPEGGDVDPAEPAEAAPEAVPDDGLETLVIHGQEKRVKREQVIEAGRRTLQMQEAAADKLREATETLNRAKAYEQGILRRQPSSDAGTQQSPSSDATNGTGSQHSTAIPDIGTLVDQKLWMHDADKAAQRFKTEYKDLVEDDLAARLVSQLEDERLAKAAAEGTPLGDPWEAYQAHGNKVREWLGRARPQGQPAASGDRVERKRDTVTVTGSTTRTPTPAPQKPPTTGEIIEQQRLARRAGRQIQPTR